MFLKHGSREEHVLNELITCINKVSVAQEYYWDNLLSDYLDYFSYHSYVVLIFQAREPPHGGSIWRLWLVDSFPRVTGWGEFVNN